VTNKWLKAGYAEALNDAFLRGERIASVACEKPGDILGARQRRGIHHDALEKLAEMSAFFFRSLQTTFGSICRPISFSRFSSAE